MESSLPSSAGEPVMPLSSTAFLHVGGREIAVEYEGPTRIGEFGRYHGFREVVSGDAHFVRSPSVTCVHDSPRVSPSGASAYDHFVVKAMPGVRE